MGESLVLLRARLYMEANALRAKEKEGEAWPHEYLLGTVGLIEEAYRALVACDADLRVLRELEHAGDADLTAFSLKEKIVSAVMRNAREETEMARRELAAHKNECVKKHCFVLPAPEKEAEAIVTASADNFMVRELDGGVIATGQRGQVLKFRAVRAMKSANDKPGDEFFTWERVQT